MKPKRRNLVPEEAVVEELPSNAWRYDRKEQDAGFHLKEIQILQLPSVRDHFDGVDWQRLEDLASVEDLAVLEFSEPTVRKLIQHTFYGEMPKEQEQVKSSIVKAEVVVVQPLKPSTENVTQETVQEQLDPEAWLDELLG